VPITRNAIAAAAAPLGLLSGAAAEARANHEPAPAISHLRASTEHLPSTAGVLRVTASIRHARVCRLSSARRVRGLPHKVRCASGRFAASLTLPANRSDEPVAYALTLSAVGRGTRTGRLQVTVGPAGTFSLAVGREFACARVPDSHVDCWGSNIEGQLGDGEVGEASVASAVGATGLSTARTVSAGETHACAALTGGAADCWGENESGQVGTGAAGRPIGRPTPVRALAGVLAVAAGGPFTCALAEAGTVACWGADLNGELGNATVATRALQPEPVTGLERTAGLAAGEAFACALEASGIVACWGENTYGQLGDGQSEEPAVTHPVAVSGLADVTQIAAGTAFACALTAAGGVDCWGEDGYGELGDEQPGHAHLLSAVPVAVHGIAGARAIAAAERDACALLAGGAVDCWGAGEQGQLGHAHAGASDVPVRVDGVGGGAALAAGGNTFCALLDSEQVQCWGSNGSGEVGDRRAGELRAAPAIVAGVP